MINTELDKQVVKLSIEYKQLCLELSNIEEKIEELEYYKDSVSTRIDEIEEKIRHTKKEILTERIQELDFETDDAFVKDFILASYFCNKDFNIKHNLEYINITNNEIQACNGYEAIIIKNLNIPDTVKNSLIKWDVRSEFETHINRDINNFIDLYGVYPSIEKYSFKLEDLTVEDFYLKVNSQHHHNDTWSGEIITINTDKAIGINKEYMDTALLAFKNEKFTLYTDSPTNAILLVNSNKSVIVLPVRI